MVDTSPSPVRDVMHPGVLCAEPDEPLIEAAATMEANDVDGLVVRADDTVEGIVTTRDLLRTLSRTGGDVTQTTVRDAMSSPVVTIPPFTNVEDTLRAMAHRGLQRMPVVYEGELLGMVTEHDILDHFPGLAPMARSFDRSLSTARTDFVRLAGRCRECDRPDTDLRELDGGHYCYDCAGSARIRKAPA